MGYEGEKMQSRNIEVAKQEKIYSPKEDLENPYWKSSKYIVKTKKFINKLFDKNSVVSEEEIKNHYNVYVYQVLPFPPKKKDKIEL